MTAEQTLPGVISTVVRTGDTVRRTAGPWTPAVHALLRHLRDELAWIAANQGLLAEALA